MTTILTATLSETRKGILILWTYKANLLFGLVAMILAFVGLSFVIGAGTFSPDRMAATLLGYLLWYYVTLITENMGENLVSESAAGTLEQMFINPTPIGFILIGRALANLVIATVQLSLIGGTLILVMKIPLHWRWEALPLLFIALLGLLGFGFMLAGLGLVFKQIHAIANISNSILLFLNGTLVPLEQFPTWLLPIAQVLPTTLAISILRRVLLEGASLVDIWHDGSLLLLIAHSVTFLVGGWLVLEWCVRIAKRQGTLGQY